MSNGVRLCSIPLGLFDLKRRPFYPRSRVEEHNRDGEGRESEDEVVLHAVGYTPYLPSRTFLWTL